MTCDDVFDALTSSESSMNEAVRSHLAECRRCRDLVEVLSPLRAEFDRPLDPLPIAPVLNFASAPSQAAVDVAQAAASRLQAAGSYVVSRETRRGPTFAGHVAAFLAGAAASLGLAATLSPSAAGLSPPAARPVCSWGRELLEKSNWQAAASGCQKCHAERDHVPGQPGQTPDPIQLGKAWSDLLAVNVDNMQRAKSV